MSDSTIRQSALKAKNDIITLLLKLGEEKRLKEEEVKRIAEEEARLNLTLERINEMLGVIE